MSSKGFSINVPGVYVARNGDVKIVIHNRDDRTKKRYPWRDCSGILKWTNSGSAGRDGSRTQSDLIAAYIDQDIAAAFTRLFNS